MRTISGLDELKQAEGDDLGTSDWHEVTQEAIDAFADVTGDHQWIHVDPERAKATPFGGTIAHGYYTLALAPRFNEQIFGLDGLRVRRQLRARQGPLPGPAAGRRARPHAREAQVARARSRAARRSRSSARSSARAATSRVCVAETLARVYEGSTPPRRGQLAAQRSATRSRTSSGVQ